MKCRWSPTLGELEGTPEKIWGTETYVPERDIHEPCVWFGLYGIPDFYSLWRHKGKKYILWAGSDIIHFKNGYHLEDGGTIKLDPGALAEWITRNCESWVENEVEREALAEVGIYSEVCPSFLGDIYDYSTSYKPNLARPRVYASVSGDNFELYGWYDINKLAEKYWNIEFHLYGNKRPWHSEFKNVIVHGRVPKKQMNDEIKLMQGGLRLLPFDGFSEILAKSVLWGQWPVSKIKYPHMLSLDELGTLKDKKEPNREGRNYYLANLNRFPWNQKLA